MKALAWFTVGLALALSCDGTDDAPPPDPGHVEGAQEHEHEHESRHDELPRSVALSDTVVEQAGVKTLAVAARVLVPTVRLPGEIIPDPDHQASVAARVDGIVQSIAVRAGDAVKAGDLLATIRAPDVQILRSADVALRARAKASHANAQRVEALVAKRMASEQEAVTAAAEAKALQAESRAAQDRLRALGVTRSSGRAVTYELRAPIDGIVLERNVVVGTPVDAGSVVATIVAAQQVWFVGHVFERDLARVDTGRAATVHLNAYPELAFAGVVDYISHQVDPGARTLSVRIPLANPDGKLRLGLYGTAYVVADGKGAAPVLAVPNSAVTQMQGRPVVFVRHLDGHFEVHDVVLGSSDPHYTEVVHGLREGEQVVTQGAFTVKSALLRSTLEEGGH